MPLLLALVCIFQHLNCTADYGRKMSRGTHPGQRHHPSPPHCIFNLLPFKALVMLAGLSKFFLNLVLLVKSNCNYNNEGGVQRCCVPRRMAYRQSCSSTPVPGTLYLWTPVSDSVSLSLRVRVPQLRWYPSYDQEAMHLFGSRLKDPYTICHMSICHNFLRLICCHVPMVLQHDGPSQR